ncbi:hypothetical protein ABZ863_18570 [Saccharomonospora sp. NPDC046836]|uniref:hypothetical protein n=1 Tax=Saccharomonospora sp. NPDC046836 TaxID=3156921 RepID=UPI0033D69D9D
MRELMIQGNQAMSARERIGANRRHHPWQPRSPAPTVPGQEQAFVEQLDAFGTDLFTPA